jgi:hypothetical protein
MPRALSVGAEPQVTVALVVAVPGPEPTCVSVVNLEPEALLACGNERIGFAAAGAEASWPVLARGTVEGGNALLACDMVRGHRRVSSLGVMERRVYGTSAPFHVYYSNLCLGRAAPISGGRRGMDSDVTW